MKLTRDFYERNTVDVAKDLLGKVFVFGDKKGFIVETEAYIGIDDKACHASFRKKETCFPMWGPAGFTYVYLIYGMYYLLNISTETENFPAAVLVRGVEPLKNVESDTNGPGKFTRAFGINKTHNNTDLVNSNTLYITDYGALKYFDITETTRIGVD